MTLYVFDVDGTLTEPAKRMSDAMAATFRHWAHRQRYFLVSGSTLEAMRQQVPGDIMENAEGWFPCLGNEFWQDGKQTYGHEATWPGGLESDLMAYVSASEYWQRAGHHIERRTGMICFSTVGRNAGPECRAAYAEWDEQVCEREKIAAELRDRYSELNVSIGGQISLDISPKGGDKAQVLKAIRLFSTLPVVFFGDKTKEGGNDYPLAQALKAETDKVNTVITVSGPEDTRSMLEFMRDNRG